MNNLKRTRSFASDQTLSKPLEATIPGFLPFGLEPLEPEELATDGRDGLPGPGRWKGIEDIVEQVVGIGEGPCVVRPPVDDDGEPNYGLGLRHCRSINGLDVSDQGIERGVIEKIGAVFSAQMPDGDGQSETYHVLETRR